MSFLTYQPDLNNAVFTQEDLEFARRYLSTAIQKVLPVWLDAPIGVLAQHWNANSNYSCFFLVDLARILSELDRNVTQKSTAVFHSKFRELLQTTSDKQFTELLTELQVASMLAQRVSPIAFEPVVPENLLHGSTKPPSPDYAIRLPDGDVFLEVTVVYFGELEAWHKAVHELMGQINSRLFKKKLARSVTFRVPLGFKIQDVSKAQVHNIINGIASKESGTTVFTTANQEATIQWETSHHYKNWDEVPKPPPRYFTMGEEGSMGPLTSTEASPIIDEATGERIVKSVRQTLDRKRTQFPHDAPYVLVMRLGQASILPTGVLDLLNIRIWANPVYKWISGICLFQPRTGFLTSDAGSWLFLSPNPNAQFPVSTSLRAVFEGRATFHL